MLKYQSNSKKLNGNSIKIVILIFLFSFCGFLNFFLPEVCKTSDDEIDNDLLYTEDTHLKNPKISGAWDASFIHIANDNWSATDLVHVQNRTGMADDPHIIENVTINGGGTGDGILIENCSQYFVIRNCTIFNTGEEISPPDWNGGIKLKNSTNGLIVNNNCSENNNMGIYLYYYSSNNRIRDNRVVENVLNGIALSTFSDNNIISGNYGFNNSNYAIDIRVECYNNSILNNIAINHTTNVASKGIQIAYSSHNTTIMGNSVRYNRYAGIAIDNDCTEHKILNNNITYNQNWGIFIGNECFNCTVSKNNVSYNDNNGIHLQTNASYNTISNNVMNNNGFKGIYVVSDCINNTISNNIVNNNSWYGIDIRGRSHNNTISGNTVNYNARFGIIITKELTENTTIRRNEVHYNGDDGILLEEASFSIVSENNITHNGHNGIYMYRDFPKNNSIKNNYIEDNNWNGIYVSIRSINNTISGNLIRNNLYSGVNVSSSSCIDNLIYNNAFVGNKLHALDSGINSQWNNSVIGNYWDNYTGLDESPKDGIGDTPYTYIPGGSSQDYKPINITTPNITINKPIQNAKFGATAPKYNISINHDIWWYALDRWYTMDGGQTNTTFTGLIGTINQNLWNNLPVGSITIRFYARDISGNESYKEITIIKSLTTNLLGGVSGDNGNGSSKESNDILFIMIIAIIGSLIGVASVGVYYIKIRKKPPTVDKAREEKVKPAARIRKKSIQQKEINKKKATDLKVHNKIKTIYEESQNSVKIASGLASKEGYDEAIGRLNKTSKNLEKAKKLAKKHQLIESVEKIELFQSNIEETLIKNQNTLSDLQKIAEKTPVEKLNEILGVSDSIKFDTMRDILNIDENTFNDKIIDWAIDYGFNIDGDVVIITREALDRFIREENL